MYLVKVKIPVNNIITDALAYGKENKNDYIIIDTAGRLQIDEKLMDELKNVEETLNQMKLY